MNCFVEIDGNNYVSNKDIQKSWICKRNAVSPTTCEVHDQACCRNEMFCIEDGEIVGIWKRKSTSHSEIN